MVAGILVGMQFQDRVCQILGHVGADHARLLDVLAQARAAREAGESVPAVDTTKWLDELAATYTTREQLDNHRGDAPAPAGESDITFF